MRHPAFRRDERAVIDVPFKLLLSVVLITMATAILMPALQAYQQSEVEHRIEIAVAEIASAARSVYHHPGSSKTVLVHIPPAGGIHLERLVIGGDLGSSPAETAVISWRHSAGSRGSHVVTTNSGPLPMASPDGEALVIDGSRCLLVLEARTAPPGSLYKTFVEVSVL